MRGGEIDARFSFTGTATLNGVRLLADARLQPLGFGYVHAPVLALPIVECRLADPMLTA